MKALVCLAAAACFAALAASSASAQDFKKSYDLKSGGAIRVTNMSGDVTVTGYDGSEVIVTGVRSGDDADRVQILDDSRGNMVSIGVKYPERCRCDASVDFVIQVPRSTAYAFDKIASMSGNVKVEGVTGAVNASAMSGDVTVGDVEGTVEATAMSGDVHVAIQRLDGAGNLAFTSMSGDVEVFLPSNAGVDVSLKTVSGSIETDFPLQVQEQKYGSSQWAKGRLGDGSRGLTAKSMSGNVRLMKN